MMITPSFFPALSPGTYRLCAPLLGGQEQVELAHIFAYPRQAAGAGQAAAGQWLLVVRGDAEKPEGIKLREIWAAVASRLGLLPPRLAPSFMAALQRDEPICLLADTSSVYHGVLELAIRLRGQRPTHLAMPDQAWMELQRHRELANRPAPKPDAAPPTQEDRLSRWLSQVHWHRRHITGARVLGRIRRSGVIVHYARPPEAMVRYFGADRGAGTSEEPGAESDVADGYFRDRLILEAARQQRALLGGMPVFLVTADANFAAQARVEDFAVGFGQRASIPDPFLLTSPLFEPYDLALRHISLEILLEELLWQWRALSLQQEGDSQIRHFRLPGSSFDLTLLELAEEVPVHTEIQSGQPRWMRETFGSATTTRSEPALPLTAPTACQLIESLINLPVQPLKVDQADYLRALGWVSKDANEALRLTDRGNRLSTSWRALKQDDVLAWSTWIADAATDVAKLPETAQLLKALIDLGNKLQKSSDLEGYLKRKEKPLRSQRALAHAFGLVVNLGGKVCRTVQLSPDEAATELLSQIPTDGIRVDRLFTSLLDRRPLSIPQFRQAISSLLAMGRIRPGGTLPDAGGGEGTSRVTVDAIVPREHGPVTTVDKVTYDLGAGDFLPGLSVQAIYPVQVGAS